MGHSGLAGKAAIVTGAGAGIGLAVAQRLAAEGCNVLCADIDAIAADTAATKVGDGGRGCEQTARARWAGRTQVQHD
ncbi:SDR family NAD(P)-dependent oxidoreductase, partial [Mycobacterium asiaticum]|uniref:SDR family NAD(P)-dependent oxidoreductase n=1 Tax=Mycobacterium asiaticum TaxID=1790 RepID=UPI000AC86E3A